MNFKKLLLLVIFTDNADLQFVPTKRIKKATILLVAFVFLLLVLDFVCGHGMQFRAIVRENVLSYPSDREFTNV
jgi:hypothetical protein